MPVSTYRNAGGGRTDSSIMALKTAVTNNTAPALIYIKRSRLICDNFPRQRPWSIGPCRPRAPPASRAGPRGATERAWPADSIAGASRGQLGALFCGC